MSNNAAHAICEATADAQAILRERLELGVGSLAGVLARINGLLSERTLIRALYEVLAFIAAVFWFVSAKGRLPPMGPYWDAAAPSDPFHVAAKFSARMNSWAAVFTGLSALHMGLKLLGLKLFVP